MSFIMIRVEVPSMNETQLNAKVFSGAAGDSTNPHVGVEALRVIMDAIAGGCIDAEVDVAVRATTQAITASGTGSSANWNLK